MLKYRSEFLRILSIKAKPAMQDIVRIIASINWTRFLLNKLYMQLDHIQRQQFWSAFAKIFRNSSIIGSSGNWKIVFADKQIIMPLTAGNFWLDWDIAVSILGHDVEVKKTHEFLIKSTTLKPDVFIDIGSNYGTHSLLYLIHGVKTLSFEPNTLCHDYFRNACERNHLVPNLEPVALGQKNGIVELVYPENETWLGSTNSEIIASGQEADKLETLIVEQKILDDYFAEIENKRAVIKIDAEGSEISILKGGENILQYCKPIVIFESLYDSKRSKIFNFFVAKRFIIHELPWDPLYESTPLTLESFCSNNSTNFIAMSKK